MVVADGEARAIEPLTDGGTIRFPDPIGERDGRRLTVTATAPTVPHEPWGERALAPAEVLAELEPRGCTFDVHESEV